MLETPLAPRVRRKVSRMRYLALIAGLAFLICAQVADGATGSPAPGTGLVYAITKSSETPPSTAIYLHDISSGARKEVYRDAEEKKRVLTRIAGVDIIHSGRAVPPGEVYLIMGAPTVTEPAACSDALNRLRITDGEQRADPEPLFPLPLCFSYASAYGLWNRAPIFAVSPGAERVALPALRAGETKFERLSIRVLSAAGQEMWRIPLDDQWLDVADLTWSPDGKSLAYIVMPQGDEHTLDEALLPKAGVYLADTEKQTTRFLYHCYADALAWGPKPDRITVAARTGDIWGTGYVIRVLALPSGKKIEEFSARGPVYALAYSHDKKWLAVQVRKESQQQIWLYPASDGWGRLLQEFPREEGWLALLGWALSAESATKR